MNSSSGESDINQRQGIIMVGTNIWFRSEDQIEELKNDLITIMDNDDEKESLNISYNRLKAFAQNLLSDVDYLKEEDPYTFKDYLEDLKNILKMIYQCIQSGNHDTSSFSDVPDNLDYLKRGFYDFLQEKRGGNRIIQAYVPITQLIRFLRNVEEHSSKPKDHITGKRSYGNLFTLVSLFILIIYAYKEILEVWIESIKIDQQRRS